MHRSLKTSILRAIFPASSDKYFFPENALPPKNKLPCALTLAVRILANYRVCLLTFNTLWDGTKGVLQQLCGPFNVVINYIVIWDIFKYFLILFIYYSWVVTRWQWLFYMYSFIHSFIHSLVFSLRGRAGMNQGPVMWPVWLWLTASWASSWG